MKYLSDYTKEKTSELFERTGAFFAFSNEQFEESRKPDVEYVSTGSGLIIPKGQVKTLTEGLAQIRKDAVAQDLEENGREAIIRRELANFECYYTGDIDDCVEALDGYGITEPEIREVFRQNRDKVLAEA